VTALDRTFGLRPLTLTPLPLDSIRPLGWLRRQLRIQADGLSGHLDEFWPDVADSGWIGGKAEGWERGPYWLDGVVPLAHLLRDEALLAKAQRWVDEILERQQPDGWLGPVRDASSGDRRRAHDPWPVFVAMKALTQHESATSDPRVQPAIARFLCRLDALLDEQPLFEWGRFRWQDLVLTIHWLYERTHEGWLLDLAAKAHNQGYDWRGNFEGFAFTERTRRKDCGLATHVVNNAMAVKAAGVWYRQSDDTADRDAVYHAIATLDRYHGQVTGVFTGDEHLAGLSPSQGTELCAVAEYMFSLEVLLQVLGHPVLADRLERIAYNAFPATFKPDMWAHQYDQQVNQVVCRIADDRVYTSNRGDANLFGLEPNYGCCTANMHQGWPKLASSLWMRSDRGLAALVYAPCTLDAPGASANVRVDVETDYPFGDSVEMTVIVDRPTRFALDLRVPGWADGATMSVGAGDDEVVPSGRFARVDRAWVGATKVRMRFPMPTVVERRYRGSAAISRGPLVYSFAVGEDWRKVGGEGPHADWEVHPTTPWNYALEAGQFADPGTIEFEHGPIGNTPFSPEVAPVRATVRGRRLPSWALEHNAAGDLPQSPVSSEEPVESLTLIPYGCTNLRVTEFPVRE
jgi:uncharacterized protein